VQSNVGRQRLGPDARSLRDGLHASNVARQPSDGLDGSNVAAQTRCRLIDGSDTRQQTSVKLPWSGNVEHRMRTSDGRDESDEDDESYNPCGEAVPLKNAV